MSGQVEAIIGGPGVKQMNAADVEPVEDWAHSEHYKSHGYTLIFGGDGPWVLCLDCDWSADLPDEMVA